MPLAGTAPFSCAWALRAVTPGCAVSLTLTAVVSSILYPYLTAVSVRFPVLSALLHAPAAPLLHDSQQALCLNFPRLSRRWISARRLRLLSVRSAVKASIKCS